MLDCRGGQAGRDAVAEAAADAVLPLCPVRCCQFCCGQFGAGEVTDPGRVDNADDVAGVVQRQRHAEAVTTGRLHADVSLLAAHGGEPNQHQLPAIGTVLEGPALLSLTSCAVRVQALLGHVDSNYRVTHFLLPFQGLNTARLRVGPPCTRDQRQAAALDAVGVARQRCWRHGHPPDSSRVNDFSPVSTSSISFRHVISVRFRSSLRTIPDGITSRLFRNVHHSGSLPPQLAVV